MTDAPPRDLSALAESTRYLAALTAEEHAITRAVVEGRRAPLAAVRPVPRLQLVAAMPWREEANCLGLDPDLFFPPRGATAQVEAARRVCAGCTVRAQCLTYALERSEERGIWGGMSERERRQMRTRLPRWARCSRCAGRFVKRASGQRFCGAGCPGLVARRTRSGRRAG